MLFEIMLIASLAWDVGGMFLCVFLFGCCLSVFFLGSVRFRLFSVCHVLLFCLGSVWSCLVSSLFPFCSHFTYHVPSLRFILFMICF